MFVCEVLTTDRYVEHYHAFEVSREVPTPVVFCSQKDLADFHALGLFKLNMLYQSITLKTDYFNNFLLRNNVFISVQHNYG